MCGKALPFRYYSSLPLEAMPRGGRRHGGASKTFGLAGGKAKPFRTSSGKAAYAEPCNMLCDTDRLFTHLEHFGEVRDDAVLNRTQFKFLAQQFLHRSHRLAFAGDNQIEVT
jgi:hypothetical protein